MVALRPLLVLMSFPGLSLATERQIIGERGPGNQRNIAVAVRRKRGVQVARTHPRNHDGEYFSVLVTRTVAQPRPGSDDISRAYEEGWVE